MGLWFGRKSAPADARPYVPGWAVSGLHVDAAEEGFACSYEARYREVFERNPVGQRAVRLVSGMLGALTVDAVEGPSTGSGQAARAVPLIQADGLLESIAANLLLHGNAYVQLIADDRDAPAELCLLRPERVSVVADDRGWPIAYLYRAGAQQTRYARLDGLGRRRRRRLLQLGRLTSWLMAQLATGLGTMVVLQATRQGVGDSSLRGTECWHMSSASPFGLSFAVELGKLALCAAIS